MPQSTTLAVTPSDLTVVGDSPGIQLGLGVATGDFNGDNIDDLLVGDVGRVYVIFGATALGGTIDLATSNPNLTVVAAEAGDNLGPLVASGDFNGDGIDDLLLGANLADGPGNTKDQAGEVYVIFGATALGGTINLATTSPDLTVVGADSVATGTDAQGDRCCRVASGDVNGDGIDDLLLGTETAEGIGNTKRNAGEAYVIFGSTALGGTIDLATTGPDLRVVGSNFNAQLIAVASGDVNGDGTDDFILGSRSAPGGSVLGPGEAYVIFGSTTLGGVIDLAATSADLTVVGSENDDLLGVAVASGDFNGDGIDDLLVSASHAAAAGNAKPLAGEAYVIFGSTTLSGTIDLATTNAGFTVLGADADDRLGGVASGDFNGDGIDDLLVGAFFADAAGNTKTKAGEAYVILGSTTLGGTIDLAATSPDLTVLGAGANDQLARGVRLTSGDLNGDGVDDVVLGAPLSNVSHSRTNAGEAYVIFGVQTNTPPTIDTGGPYDVDEGGSRIVIAAGTDAEDDVSVLTFEWDLDDNGSFETPGLTPTFDASSLDGPNTHTIVVSVTDSGGLTATDQTTVDVLNVAPSVGDITAPTEPVQVGMEISASADFTDPGAADTHMAEWDWGDEAVEPGTVTQAAGSGSVADSHTYTVPGVYTITLTLTDSDEGQGQSIFQFVVVYDPDGGFVTGGGWIDSPEGACQLTDECQNETGKANFGFVSKYKKGASVPTGETEFQFQSGDLDFHSSSYEWLVIAGARAQYKGDGAINGLGNFGFILTAIDQKLTPSTNVDLFRIKIWDKDSGDNVVYDNQLGDLDDADATTELGGGNIVVHKK